MMKNIIILLIIGFFVSCSTDNFEELNTDKKRPSAIPAEPLFTNSTINLIDLMSECSVNSNVFRLYSQYWAQTTYPDESQYNMVTRNIPDNIFTTMYRDVLRDLSECTTILNSQELTNDGDKAIRTNKNSIIKVMEVYVYSVLVDIFGDVPYSQALSNDYINPAYDRGSNIYASILVDLDEAIANLDGNVSSFGSADPIYNGDASAWKAFAQSLKLKLGMRLADVDNAEAKSIVESAYSGVFSNENQSAKMTYFSASPYTNPLYENLVLSGRNDFIPANTVVDKMNELNDPRRALFFQLDENGAYNGGIYGTANAYSDFSHLADVFLTAELPGNLMDYSEVLFLLSEAAARGYSVGGTAEEYYNAAITASILSWGGSQEDADNYLSQVSVAYASASGDWREKIGTQKWLSMFNNGFEGWTTWRIFDFSGFNVPDGLSFDDIPMRMIFPINEATLNGASVKAAANNYNGDSPKAKIFWDVN
jgi:hypothetical protein